MLITGLVLIIVCLVLFLLSADQDRKDLSRGIDQLETDLESWRVKCRDLNINLTAAEKRIEQYDIALSLKASTIEILQSRITISRTTDLSESMTDIVRFIAANQWLIEKDRDLAEACESLSGVATSSIENEDV